MGNTSTNDGTKKCLLGIVAVVIAILAGKIVACVGPSMGIDVIMAVVIVRSVIAVGAFIALGGIAWLRFDAKSVRKAWSFAKPLIIVNLLIGLLLSVNVILLLVLGDITIGDALRTGAYVTILCFFVGINEELMFRGLLMGGFLAKLGDRKNGALYAALISSIAFGAMHVVFDMDYSNAYSIISGLMKTLECAMFGFILCVPALEDHCLWGPITAHAFFDWIILVGNAIAAGGMHAPSYVSSDPKTAMIAIGLFTALAIIYTPRTIRSVKELRALEVPQGGPFAG